MIKLTTPTQLRRFHNLVMVAWYGIMPSVIALILAALFQVSVLVYLFSALAIICVLITATGLTVLENNGGSAD